MNKVNNKIFVLAIVTFVVILTLLALMLTGVQTMKAPSEESMIESTGQEDAAVRETESTTPNRQKTFCINEGGPRELCGNAINIGIPENTGDIIFDTWISEESIQAILDNPSCETMAQTETIGFDIKFEDTEKCFTIIEEDNVFIGGMSIGAYYEGSPRIFSGVLWIHKRQPYQLEMLKNETIDYDQRKIRENILRELDDQYGTPGLPEFAVGYDEIKNALSDYMQTSPTIEQALTEMKHYITNRLWSYSNSLPKAFALNGNVYYVNEGGIATLIAEKERPETCPNGDSGTFCFIDYEDAILSPYGTWIALPAQNHEWFALRFYNIETETLYEAEGYFAGGEMRWSEDGKFIIEQTKCGDGPTQFWEDCGPFESIRPETPWIMTNGSLVFLRRGPGKLSYIDSEGNFRRLENEYVYMEAKVSPNETWVALTRQSGESPYQMLNRKTGELYDLVGIFEYTTTEWGEDGRLYIRRGIAGGENKEYRSTSPEEPWILEEISNEE